MRLLRPSVVAALSLVVLGTGCGGGGSEPTVGPPAAVTAVSGATAGVVAGTTTPIPLVAKVADASGKPVPGVAITWATQTGAVSPSNASTDASGQSTAQWTPGTAAGSQSASATVSGVGTASFSVTVSPAALVTIKLAPDTLKLTTAGQTGVIVVAGSDAFGNFIPSSSLGVVFVSDNPNVAAVTSTGTVTAVASGSTRIRATAGAGVSASTIVVVSISGVNPCDGVTMTLGVGESQTLTGTAANQFCVNGGSSGAEFVAIPFFATGNGGTGSGQGTFTAAPALPLTVTPINNTTASGPPSPSVASSAAIRTSVGLDGARGLVRDVVWESRFRERVRKQFGPLIQAARRAHQSRRTMARNSLAIARDIAVNDLVQLNVDLGGCTASPKFVPARVGAVSKHAIVVEDTTDAGGFTQADYQFFADKFDSQVWPVDSTNFGAPTDIDQNGHIILFFTKAVNALTEIGNNSSFVGGFFYGRDEFYKADTLGQGGACPASNQAEMFYLLAPDPNGATNNHTRTVSFVRSITIGTVAHEFQHLINFGSHQWTNPTQFNSYEETFLDEGLAHEAEELNYYAATNRSPRTNIDSSTLINPIDAYLAFANPNTIRFREYLKNPDKYPPYSVLADTSLAVRGGIWSLLRYSADQRAGSVPEKTTWFQLVNPTTNVQGVNNLKAVFGSDFLSRMRDWAIANYMDDAGISPTAAAYQHPSWNTRSVQTYVNGSNQQNGTTFPLRVRSLVSTQASLTLADGGAAYLRFGVAANQVGGGTVTSNASLPSSFSITVIRTK